MVVGCGTQSVGAECRESSRAAGQLGSLCCDGLLFHGIQSQGARASSLHRIRACTALRTPFNAITSPTFALTYKGHCDDPSIVRDATDQIVPGQCTAVMAAPPCTAAFTIAAQVPVSGPALDWPLVDLTLTQRRSSRRKVNKLPMRMRVAAAPGGPPNPTMYLQLFDPRPPAGRLLDRPPTRSLLHHPSSIRLLLARPPPPSLPPPSSLLLRPFSLPLHIPHIPPPTTITQLCLDPAVRFCAWP